MSSEVIVIFTLFGSNVTTTILTKSKFHVYVPGIFYLQFLVFGLNLLAGWLKCFLWNWRIVHFDQAIIGVDRNWVVRRCETSPRTHIPRLFKRLTASRNSIHTVVTRSILLFNINSLYRNYSSWRIKNFKFFCRGWSLDINFDLLFKSLFFNTLLWLLHYRFPRLDVSHIFRLQVINVEVIWILWFTSACILPIAFNSCRNILTITIAFYVHNVFIVLHFLLFLLSAFFLNCTNFLSITNNSRQFMAEFLTIGPFVFFAKVLVLSLLILLELALDADDVKND